MQLVNLWSLRHRLSIKYKACCSNSFLYRLVFPYTCEHAGVVALAQVLQYVCQHFLCSSRNDICGFGGGEGRAEAGSGARRMVRKYDPLMGKVGNG